MARRTASQLALPGVTRPRRPVVPERAFQGQVVDLLELCGWAVNHVYALRTENGWRTGTTAVGFPDLVALRGAHIVAIEVKGTRTAVGPEQVAWLRRFAAVAGGCGWLIRPDHPGFDLLASWVRDPGSAPALWLPAGLADAG